MKAQAIIDIVEGVTKRWAKQRKAEERDVSARSRRLDAMRRMDKVTFKDAAYAVMEDAWNKASSNGTLPANARQIMYAARPYILAATGNTKLGDSYFIQTLLVDYIEEYERDWNVIFDARGRFTEPHTGHEVPLGTLQVRRYIDMIGRHTVEDQDFNIGEWLYPTKGPNDRYGAILFIEKEEFAPLLKHVKLADRYDIAVMSTKGMSVTASRELVQAMSLLYSLPVYVAHDFDISGFSIFGTLGKSNRRFKYDSNVKVVDLGLRLPDIVEGMEAEVTQIEENTQARAKRRETLKRHGASRDEMDFLVPMHGNGQRVELNAFTSDALVAWIERKLNEHGVAKLVPDETVLVDAYKRISREAVVQKEIDRVLAVMKPEADATPPDNLHERVKDMLNGPYREESWDSALRRIVKDGLQS